MRTSFVGGWLHVCGGGQDKKFGISWILFITSVILIFLSNLLFHRSHPEFHFSNYPKIKVHRLNLKLEFKWKKYDTSNNKRTRYISCFVHHYDNGFIYFFSSFNNNQYFCWQEQSGDSSMYDSLCRLSRKGFFDMNKR